MHVEAEHLADYLTEGALRIVPTEVCRAFSGYLDSLPWDASGARLDWAAVPHREIRLRGVSEEDVVTLLGDSRAARHGHLLVLYSPTEPGLLCDFSFGARNFDELYWKAPGVRFMCGAGIREGELVPISGDLIQVDGGAVLTALI
ncbi:hypothetical protein [Saccharothrix hoggarensis]|uniref:Uncharacterized protein n=1 Tax=Saccharothrix hoggarensis TaxID=913853 RepID=A0ABW3QUN5_9PSEU